MGHETTADANAQQPPAPVRVPGAWRGRVSSAEAWKSWTPEDDRDWYGGDRPESDLSR